MWGVVSGLRVLEQLLIDLLIGLQFVAAFLIAMFFFVNSFPKGFRNVVT